MQAAADNIFRTSDFPLVVTLAVWFPIQFVDRTDSRRASFVFQRTPELEEIIDEYHREELRVEPKAYHVTMKMVKGRLYDG